MSIATWTQYVLDSYATVKEAVESLEKEPFTIIAPILPNGVPGVGQSIEYPPYTMNYYLRVVTKDAKGRVTNRLLGTVLKKHADAYAAQCKMPG